MKKILVTGAGGYIGRHVVTSLLNKGVHVIATDIIEEGIPKESNEIIIYDIFSGDKDIFNRLGSPDICIHMAWKDGFIHSSKSHMLNLSKHFEFISNMIDGGLKNLAVMGTMHEIGYHEGVINERTNCNPTSFYGIAKDSLRRSCINLAKEKNVIFKWLRAYYIFGDDYKSNSIFSKIIKAANEGKKQFPFTTGKNKYDFISIYDLANQISAAVTQDKINGIINCCSGSAISLADQVENFILDNSLDIELSYGEYPDREYDSSAVWGDNSKIMSILNHE